VVQIRADADMCTSPGSGIARLQVRASIDNTVLGREVHLNGGANPFGVIPDSI